MEHVKNAVFGKNVCDRIVYLDLNSPLRTDETFKYKDDEYHHTGHSLLEIAEIGMISQFRLDPFHLVWHGAFKRLMTVWDTWPGVWKWTTDDRNKMTDILATVKKTCPQDFNRKPRSIREWNKFKATEERRLCLYDGILVFRDQLTKNVYKNFLLFHAAIIILASSAYVKSLCDFANICLKNFISHSISIYSRKFVVYNVHSFSSLPNECKEHGELDSFSAFDFENLLKSLKETLRSGNKPLQQVVLRYSERIHSAPVQLITNEKLVHLSRQHHDPDEIIPGSHFKRINIGGVVL